MDNLATRIHKFALAAQVIKHTGDNTHAQELAESAWGLLEDLDAELRKLTRQRVTHIEAHDHWQANRLGESMGVMRIKRDALASARAWLVRRPS